MLQYSIAMSNSRDTTGGERHDLDARPLNARSLALSALLGTHPPTLTASSLVALAELFGFSGGSMRTALSRLAAAGDVSAHAGRYTLAERLLARQRSQDVGRRAPADWDGRWHTAIAVVEQRELADRRRVRAEMANARFGELRPTVWLRPANLPAPELGQDWIVTTGPISGDGAALTATLWDLEEMATAAHTLARAVRATMSDLDQRDVERIPATFTLSAHVVRFLRQEPLLPSELVPPAWPVPELRDLYTGLEATLQAMLRPFLLAHA